MATTVSVLPMPCHSGFSMDAMCTAVLVRMLASRSRLGSAPLPPSPANVLAKVSTAIELARRPAACPPMPSQTTRRASTPAFSFQTSTESSFSWRWRPGSVPKASRSFTALDMGL